MTAGQETKYASAPRVVPRTTEEMQHPEFWISNMDGDPDRIILTPEQINKLNWRNRSLPKEIKDIKGNPYNIYDVIEYKNSIGLQFNVEDPLSISHSMTSPTTSPPGPFWKYSPNTAFISSTCPSK